MYKYQYPKPSGHYLYLYLYLNIIKQGGEINELERQILLILLLSNLYLIVFENVLNTVKTIVHLCIKIT